MKRKKGGKKKKKKKKKKKQKTTKKTTKKQEFKTQQLFDPKLITVGSTDIVRSKLKSA